MDDKTLKGKVQHSTRCHVAKVTCLSRPFGLQPPLPKASPDIYFSILWLKGAWCSNWTLMNYLKMTMHLFHLLSHLLGSAQTICAISNGHNSTTCVRIFLMISRCHFVVMRNETYETTVACQSCEIQWRIKKNRWERYDGSEKADVRPDRQAVSFMPPHSTF